MSRAQITQFVVEHVHSRATSAAIEWNYLDKKNYENFKLPHINLFFRCPVDLPGLLVDNETANRGVPCGLRNPRSTELSVDTSSSLPDHVGRVLFQTALTSPSARMKRTSATIRSTAPCENASIYRNARVNNYLPCFARYDDMCFELSRGGPNDVALDEECSTVRFQFPMQPIVVSDGTHLDDGNWYYVYTGHELVVAPVEWADYNVIPCSSTGSIEMSIDERVAEAEETWLADGQEAFFNNLFHAHSAEKKWIAGPPRIFSHSCLVPDKADVVAAGVLSVKDGALDVIVSIDWQYD